MAEYITKEAVIQAIRVVWLNCKKEALKIINGRQQPPTDK